MYDLQTGNKQQANEVNASPLIQQDREAARLSDADHIPCLCLVPHAVDGRDRPCYRFSPY